ncbi:probable hydrolase PNKD [Amphiura filiformis]|uniref:probable hydrolase PNKD n=1 Tax=Amphiura filiformis TaxID=82378 RepID=UPI003B20CBA9
MLMTYALAVIGIGFVAGYLYLKKMFKAGSPLFAVGYMVYSKTSLGSYYHQKNIKAAKEKHPDGHSVVEAQEFQDYKIQPIPLVADNYAYLIIEKSSNTGILVDPSDAATVQVYVDEANVTISAILTTHKHWDHSGGNTELKKVHQDARVYGNSNDGVPGITHHVNDKDEFKIGNLQFTALFTPGHTVGHTAFVLEGSPKCVFTGDLLFVGGCGRMFEGTAPIMLSSINKIADLPGDTIIWPGHEYAKDNLDFAQHIDPNNEDVKSKLAWVKEKRKDSHMTIPSTVAEEKTYNPFLRTDSDAIMEAVGIKTKEGEDQMAARSRAFAELRACKDKYNYVL